MKALPLGKILGTVLFAGNAYANSFVGVAPLAPSNTAIPSAVAALPVPLLPSVPMAPVEPVEDSAMRRLSPEVSSGFLAPSSTNSAANLAPTAALSPAANLASAPTLALAPILPTEVSAQNLKSSEASSVTSAPSKEAEQKIAELNTAAAVVGEPPAPNLAREGILVLAILGGFAAVGIVLVKMKKGNLSANTSSPIEIVSTLSLSPKRQILIVRIKGKEFALASTEQGISVIGDLDFSFQQEPSVKSFAPQRVSLPRVRAESELQAEVEQQHEEGFKGRKENLLQSALQGIKKSSESKVAASKGALSPQSTLSSRAGSFPKYLAKNFETSRENGQENEQENIPENFKNGTQINLKSRTSPREESVEDVTNIIRKKLREISTAGSA